MPGDVIVVDPCYCTYHTLGIRIHGGLDWECKLGVNTTNLPQKPALLVSLSLLNKNMKPLSLGFSLLK